MKTHTLIPIGIPLAALAAVALGSSASAALAAAGPTTPPNETDLDRASAAALAETGTGTGTVTAFEVDRRGFDVEVILDDGTEIDVELDPGFAVVRSHTEAHDDDDFGGELADVDLARAYDAALSEAGNGTIASVELDDRGGYDVEVILDDGTELEVEVSRSFEIERTERDD